MTSPSRENSAASNGNSEVIQHADGRVELRDPAAESAAARFTTKTSRRFR